MARLWLAFALYASISSLAGCSFAPAYSPPAVESPAAFKEAGPWIPATPSDLVVDDAWWTLYGDATLNALEQRIGDTPGLAAALARRDEASAYLAQARAGLFPQIGLGASLTQNRQSDNRPLRGSNQPDLYAADTLGGDVDYELDLWGRVRNGIAAGYSSAQASADDVAVVRLSLESQLASSYVALRGYDQQIELLSATADAYAQADAMTRRRFDGGIASAVDTSRSGAQLAEAQAQLADVRAARALTEHAIASLVGTPASDFSIEPAVVSFAMPAVPSLLPSTLLQRRPDVAASERRMFAANREIGVAKAAYFPSISLSGDGGFQNTGLADLPTAPNIFWSIGPKTILNLFDGGRRRARTAQAKARWTQATAAYRSQVLQAFQEVEDSLAQLHHLGEEAAAEQRAVDQASMTEALSLNRYEKGAVAYLDVVTAQATALRTRRASIDIATRRLQSSIRLIKSLGGGWRAETDGQS